MLRITPRNIVRKDQTDLKTQLKHRDASGVCFESLEDRRLLSTGVTIPRHIARSVQAAVTVIAADESAPVIAAVPNATLPATSSYSYPLVVSGSPAPALSLTSAPTGMALDVSTGLLSWVPTVDQVGVQTIQVRASNSEGSSSTSFTITVSRLAAPVITVPTGVTAVIGGLFTYQVMTTGSAATGYSLVSAPAGMVVSAAGLISWPSVPAPAGVQNVTVSAFNSAGSSTATFPIAVIPDTVAPTAPIVTIGPITSVSSIPLSWTGATDNVGVVGYRIYNFTPAVYRGHSGRGGGYTLVSPAKFTLLVDVGPATSYTFSGLLPSSTHQYAVTAYDAVGNQSGYSSVVIGTTLLAPSFTWSSNGSTMGPALSDVANHSLTFYLYATGSPAPTLALVSAPVGVVFTPGQVTNSQLTYVTPQINWTPTPDETGLVYVTLQATNSVGTYSYSIPVNVTPDTPQLSLSLNGGITYSAGQFAAGQSNYAVTANPAFGNAATPQYGFSGTPFNFQVTSASNSSPTTFSLVSGPAGMSVNPVTGAGLWRPTADQAGTTAVTIAATNSAGTSTLQLNFPTYFTGAPGTPSASYYTTVSGTRTNNPTLSWTAPLNTAGIVGYKISVTPASTGVATVFDTLNAATTFTVTGLTALQYFVTVTPYNASGGTGQTSAAMSVLAGALPTVSWTIGTPTAMVGNTVSVQLHVGNSNAGSYSIVSGPNGATIDPKTGVLTWTPTAGGDNTVVIADANLNGWGTVDAVVTVPVYYTNEASLVVQAMTDSSGNSVPTAYWAPPTVNTDAIVGYQVVISSPLTLNAYIVTYVSASSAPSLSLSDYGVTTGSIQVTAIDSAGNFGISTQWITF